VTALIEDGIVRRLDWSVAPLPSGVVILTMIVPSGVGIDATGGGLGADA
jgi:hypothetical protein